MWQSFDDKENAMKTRIFALLLCLVLLLTGCGKKDKNEGYTNPETQGTTADLGDDNKSFGESLDGKLLILIRSHLFIFAFISNILGGGS